ncbi:MAG TPA: hypothetical protein VKA54_03950 [Gemmatimonadaceae bacterium]|nr:hypothetical protein [Gemmatimonadaceae bacterium]
MGPRVVRVYEVRVPGTEHGADAACGGQVPVTAHSDSRHSNPGRAKATDEWRIRGGDHERLVTLLTLPAREEIDLALAAAPFSAGVKVQNTERRLGVHPAKDGRASSPPQRKRGWHLN